MKRSRPQQVWSTALILGLLAGAACTKKDETKRDETRKDDPKGEPASGPGAPVGAAAPAAGVSTIQGTVKLTGTAPEMKMLKREADPFCGRVQMKDEEVIVAAGGGLKNVLVRLVKGVTGSYPAPSTPASIDQSECMFRPRVQGIMAGQPLAIKNGDQTLHNVHTYKGPSTIFNQAEIPGMPAMVRRFDGPSEIIKFKCDVHPWMTGYVAVTNHPFFAVTGDDGTFTIANVPAGTYTLEAWQERLGTTTAEVTVAAGKPATVALTLAAR
jgi:plastocyanin